MYHSEYTDAIIRLTNALESGRLSLMRTLGYASRPPSQTYLRRLATALRIINGEAEIDDVIVETSTS